MSAGTYSAEFTKEHTDRIVGVQQLATSCYMQHGISMVNLPMFLNEIIAKGYTLVSIRKTTYSDRGPGVTG